MPVAVSYPGVYVEEISSGVRTITGVATSITAFLGRAARGPVNKPVIINSYADFERKFGGLVVDHPMSYAVKDFYLNGGSQAIIVRLYKPYFTTNEERLAEIVKAKAETDKAVAAVSDAVNKEAATPAAPPATAQSVADAAKKAADDVKTTKPAYQAVVKAAAAIVAKAAADAAKIENPEPTAESVKAAAIGAAAGASTTAANSAGPRSRALIARNGLQFEAAYDGSWGNQLRIRVESAPEGKFNLKIGSSEAGLLETFLNLSVEEGPRRIDRVLKNESTLLRVLGDAPYPMPAPHNAKPAENKGIWTDTGTSTPVGDDGNASDSKELDGADDFLGEESKKTGLYALEDADLFNLLCIPADKRDQGVDTDADDLAKAVYSKALPYCVKRRAMLIVDPPSAWNSASSVLPDPNLGLTGTDARNAAIYFPRILESDPLRDGQIGTFVPCGLIAGAMARTDTQRGVWKAPAGIDVSLNGTVGLSVNLTDPENGQLNPLGVNCLRSFPVYGRVVWGARTLRGSDQAADEWKYIPVRRLALYIEESLFRGLKWVVFEPNDEPLWAQIRLNAGAFMQNLFRQGAFQGSTRDKAYFVKCDKETTTQNDIDLGIVNIHIGFAPLKPAEFVIIKMRQLAGQLEV